MSQQEVWLVTGASSGFGLEIALAALSRGFTVVGTVRSKSKSAEAVRRLETAGGETIELDVSHDEATIAGLAHQVEGRHGRIDVLVNNAGYSLLGAVEDFTEAEATLQHKTNVIGPLNLTKALLPGMRRRKAGTIVNVSSIAGLDGLPSCGLYAASKFALEGMSEALAREVGPWNIRVLIVEPGAFRTNFLGAFVRNEKGLNPAYQGTPVDEVLSKFQSADGEQPGDPVKGAKAIVEVVAAKCKVDGIPVLRLPLGIDCLARMEEKLKSLNHDLTRTRSIAEGTGYAES